MMLWLTRMSLFDTMDDIDTDLLATQRVDAWQLFTSFIYDTQLVAESHPVWRCWVGYEAAVAAYGAATDAALAARSIGHGGLGMHFARGIEELRTAGEEETFVMPPWTDDADVLRSHRSNMVRRWPEHYADTWRGTPALMPYLWPFLDEDGGYGLFVSKQEQKLLKAGERTLPKKIRERVMNLT